MNQTNKGLSSFGLKYIAIITMTIDHAGMMFLSYGTAAYTIARGIGRIAFPVYCFLLVEGFFHTSNRKAYLSRLLAFALISEIPFDMALYHFPQVTNLSILSGHQNVFFTLTLGFLAMCLIEKYRDKGPFVSAIIGIGCMFLAEFLQTDYSFIGVIVILLFYLYKHTCFSQPALYRALLPMLPLLAYGNFCVLLAVPILALYNGQKGSVLPNGREIPAAKYFFYVYYPLHLTILSVIYYFI